MAVQKKLISEAQIKEVIREEFASSGVILTEEQLEELFGLFGKSKLIKQIKAADADGTELDKLGYDASSLKGLPKSSLKQILGDLRDVTGTKEPKGFVQKVKDVYAGVKDIGILGGGAGTLLGGEETFDIEKRKALKGTAEKQLQGWLKKLKYPPATSLYTSLRKQGFPNNDKNDFMGNTAEIYNEYDKVVKDYKAKQIECDAANTIIAVLRALVIYFQDFGMADKYFYVNEQEEPEQEEKMGAAQGSVSKNFAAAYGNKLPLGLAAAGLGALAAGFTADSEFFQDFLQGFTDMENIPTAGEVTRNISSTLQLGDVQGGEGIIKVVRRLTDMKDFGTPGGPGLGQLADPKYRMVLNLVKASMIAKEGPRALIQAIQQNANPTQLFVAGPSSGTAKAGEELFGLNKGTFEKNITNVISDKVEGFARAPADTVKNQFLGALGNFLGPVLKGLGLGALVAALASFTMRQKGKGKMGGSRMSRLKGIVDEMVDIPCDDDTGPEDPCKDKPGTTWNPETKECEEDTGPEDPCKDKPGTRWNPETKTCEEPPEPPEPPTEECDPETEVLDPKTGKCIKKPKPQTGKAVLRLPAIAVLDDDTVSTFRINWRKQDDIDAQADIYAAAEKANIVGRDSSPRSDQVAADSTEKRWGPANLQTFKQIKRRATSSKGEAPYFAIDASIITDLGNKRGKSKDAGLPRAGLGKENAIRITKDLFKLMLKDEKKVKKAVAMDKLMRLGIEDEKQLQKALAQLVQYGLVDGKEARSKRKKRAPKKKAGGEEEIVTDLDRRGNPITESLTLARWKVLSGIK
jgi:hypothetical protein